MVTAETTHRLDSWLNLRGHWLTLQKRKNTEKAVTMWMLASMGDLPTLPAVVTLTRHGPKFLDDDNLPGAFKYVRDTIAKALGTHDGPSAPVKWIYAQKRTSLGGPRYGFTVTIESEGTTT